MFKVELWNRGSETPVDLQTKARKWGWVGHTLHKSKRDKARTGITRDSAKGETKNNT